MININKIVANSITITTEEPIKTLCFTAEQAGSTIKMIKCIDMGQDIPPVNLLYSTDGTTWNTFLDSSIMQYESETVTLSNIGDKVYIKAGPNGNTTFYNGDYWQFVMTGSIAASGNINCMLNGDHPELATLAENCYSNMFSGCTSLTTAPELPATTLADGCYASMFYGCTSLTTAPDLPNATLESGCYNNMFNGCTSLTKAPLLPATTLVESCYSSMFYDCTALTTAPELPATTLAYGCYSSMFVGCTSLTTAPELPATTLAESCYLYMFSNCTSLTTAPELPATTLAENCYSNMFADCTSLTTAPELPATTLAKSCYLYMFSNCTSLDNISVGFTAWNQNATSNWLKNVASTGTFTCPTNLPEPETRNSSNIPSGWSIVRK